METVRSERFPQLFWGMVALGLGLVLAALIGAATLKSVKRAGDQIEVTGSFKKQVRSDYGVWKSAISIQGPDLQGASAEVAGDAQRLRAFLRANGIADSAVSVKPLETEAIYRTAENGANTSDLLGYKVTQRIEVRSADVARVTQLSQRASELIAQGVPLSTSSVDYLYTQLEKVRGEMLADATRDARARAEAIAKAAGATVGSVRSAKMGVFQVTPRNSTEVSDYGMNDTSSLDKDVTAVVRVTFAVD
ncbi:SIMPL domain-containing protein [Longimicrobium sp.]|uniref:SIMPL domain-containing protein n=1 Tax=Longimicrobium sp. TaxID=2029185 RepID=UPI002BA15BDB|nr:SIMPL domain-containing protein [Longimicrobium sp.]HSU12751.1 SIMPL domain-containing protein [Longimicrobium sp.]